MNESPPPSTPQPRRPRRLRRWIVGLLIAAALLIVAGELFARLGLGLGDPPLVQTDPEIEYLYQPSKTYRRFGNDIAFNRWSMRSDDFEQRTAPDELRVLIIGDSVINGGAQSDQPAIASEIIRRELPERVNGRPVTVGNASCGSWGPANMLAYVDRFGFLEADVVIIVLSSHDWADAPTFGELGADFPTSRPALALQEALMRYLPRYLPALGGSSAPAEPEAALASDDPAVVSSLTALDALLRKAMASGAKVAVAQHLERDERMDRLQPGHMAIGAVARAADVGVIQLGPSFEQARRAGEQPYRDEIHPNDLGQRVIARTLMDWIVAQLRQ